MIDNESILVSNVAMNFILLPILTILFISCNSQPSGSTDSVFDKGTLQGNTFSNKYFGFKLKIDTPWHLQNQLEFDRQVKERAEMLNKELDKSSIASKGIDILLSLTADTLQNIPQVMITSLDIPTYPQIKNEIDYLNDYSRQVKKMYKDYDVQILSSEIGREMIGKNLFFTNLITIKADNFLAYQKRYSIKLNNKLLNLMTNYTSDGDSKRCFILLNSIQWD